MDLDSMIKELWSIGRAQRGFENPRRTLFIGLSKLLQMLSEHELAFVTDHICGECSSALVRRIKLDIDDPFGLYVCLHCKTESDSVKEESEEGEVF